MTEDVTTLLIQTIYSRPDAAQPELQTASQISGSTTDLLSSIADWNQVLGTVLGPSLQLAAVSQIKQLAATAASGGGQGIASTLSASLSATAASPGDQSAAQAAVAQATADQQTAQGAAAGSGAAASAALGFTAAAIVMVVSVVLSLIGEAGSDKSVQNAQYNRIIDGINGLDNATLILYWLDKLTSNPMATLWTALQANMDNIAAEGLTGYDVVNGPSGVGSFHTNGLEFCNQFLPTSSYYANEYWSVGQVPQHWVPPGLGSSGWYGTWPEAPVVQVAGTATVQVADPRTLLPLYALGLQSWWALEALRNVISADQPTIGYLIGAWSSQLQDHLGNLYTQYSQAVLGIVKSQVPTQADIIGCLCGIFEAQHTNVQNGDPSTQGAANWGGSPGAPGSAFPRSGYAWNWLVGVVETYPNFGSYPPPTGRYASGQYPAYDYPPFGYCSPSYFISDIGLPPWQNFWDQLVEANFLFQVNGSWYISGGALGWIPPWLQNVIVIGLMARWKAIYLINGYDRVWSIMKQIQFLVGPDYPVLPELLHLPDGTVADGHWYVRDLMGALPLNPGLMEGNTYGTPQDGFSYDWEPDSGGVSLRGLSCTGLLQYLQVTATSSWAGPNPGATGQMVRPAGPLSFRTLLREIGTMMYENG